MLGRRPLAIELREQPPETAAVLASVGGGGLLAGICAGYAGQAAMSGWSPAGAPTLTRALAAGAPVDAEVGSVAVDSLAPRRIGERTFAVLRAAVREVVLVSDGDIGSAQELLWDRLRLVAEPGGCAALAAVLSGRFTPGPDGLVTVVVSGANTTAVDFTAERDRGGPGPRGGVGTRPTAQHPPRRQERRVGQGGELGELCWCGVLLGCALG